MLSANNQLPRRPEMKKPYSRPEIESENAFEVLAAGCGAADPFSSDACDPDNGGIQYNS
jgi:hypothetical protein